MRTLYEIFGEIFDREDGVMPESEPMNCPHCNQPIDPALIAAERNRELASRPRPGSAGNQRAAKPKRSEALRKKTPAAKHSTSNPKEKLS